MFTVGGWGGWGMWIGRGTVEGARGKERKFHMNSRLKAHANEVHHLGGCLVSFFSSWRFQARTFGREMLFMVDPEDSSVAVT